MTTRAWAALGAAGVYGITLGAATIIMPLLAVSVGYSTAEVGYLATISAAVQIGARLGIGWLLHRVADRHIVAVSAVSLMASVAVVLMSTSWAAFVVAMALQGASRAGFWTGVQTHVVRGNATISKGLAAVHLLAEGGQFIGPLAAGYAMEVSYQFALYIAAGLSGLAGVASLCMVKLAPFRGSEGSGRPSAAIGRNMTVIGGCVGVGVAGAWRALLTSYIPGVLAEGDLTPSTVGVVVALASAASTAAAGVLTAVSAPRSRLVVTGAALAVGLGVAPLGYVAGSFLGAAVCALVGGAGAGLLQVLGMAIASEAVHPDDRGKVIALAGVVRSGAMVTTPLAIAGLLVVTTLNASLAVVGGLLSSQAAVLHWAQRRR